MIYDKLSDELILTPPELGLVRSVLGERQEVDDEPVAFTYGKAREVLVAADARGIPQDPVVRDLLDTMGALMIRGHHNPGDVASDTFGPEALQPYPHAEALFTAGQ